MRLAPTPSAASRIEGGTDLIALRPAMTITGMVISASVSPPTKGADRGRCMKLRNTARPSSPKMIDGTGARLLIGTSIGPRHRAPGATGQPEDDRRNGGKIVDRHLDRVGPAVPRRELLEIDGGQHAHREGEEDR